MSKHQPDMLETAAAIEAGLFQMVACHDDVGCWVCEANRLRRLAARLTRQLRRALDKGGCHVATP